MARKARTSFWWFSDFELRREGLFVRKTGQRLGSAVLTLGEIWNWLGYYALVRGRGVIVRAFASDPIRIWFAPEKPRPWYVIWAACTWAGMRFAKSEDDADLCFYFDDVTKGSPPVSSRPYVNALCWDISKTRVARIFGEVAGYKLTIDPQSHHGLAVEKGERNGAHDGRIVSCPMTPAAGKCYERLVDGTEQGVAIDFRVSIIDRRPVAVLRKTKAASKRFSIHNDDVRWVELMTAFRPGELDLILRFCQEMQLDCGALDVLRDRRDGRIYIVDVNKTDTGPAVDLSWEDRIKLTSALADALKARHAKAHYTEHGVRTDA